MSKGSLEATCRRSRPFVVALLYVTPHGIDPSEREIARGITLPLVCVSNAAKRFASVCYVFRASSIRSTLSLPEPTKVKRMVI